MKLSLLAAVFLLVQIGTNPSQVPQASQASQGRKATIGGVVLRSTSGDPVAGARVTLTRLNTPAGSRGAAPTAQAVPPPQAGRGVSPAPASIPAGVTDSTGKFAFEDLDEGSYTLQVQANGYVSQYYGQRYPTGGGVPVKVTAGQLLNNVSVQIIPAGNISGRIHDRSDQPLINVPVQLLRYAFNAQGQRTYQSAGATRTDDHGDYRFYWVTPGRYYLMVGSANSGSNAEAPMLETLMNSATNANQPTTLVGYAYYPGAPDIGSAMPIDVQPGADLNGLGMTLTPKPQTFRIRGRVVDSRTGQAPPTAAVTASPQMPGSANLDQFGIGTQGATRNYNAANGTFELRGLLPGIYVVNGSMQDPGVGGRGGVAISGNPQQAGRSSGSTTVAISGGDVDGVVLTLLPAATISGRVRVEGTLPAGMAMERLRFQLSSIAQPNALLSNINMNISPKPDGTIQFLYVVPGDYRVSLQAQGAGVYLKEARLEGVDAFAVPLHVSATSSGLDFVVGVGGGRVAGTLTDQRSQPVPVSQVVLVPDRLRERADLFRFTISSDTGAFVFANVPPGDYKVFSWEGAEPYSWFDAELLARSEGKAHAVRVTDASVETAADIKIIPAGGTR